MLLQPSVKVLSPGEDTGVLIEITGSADAWTYPIPCLVWSNAAGSEAQVIAAKLFPGDVSLTGKLKVVAQGGKGKALGTLDVYLTLASGEFPVGGRWATDYIGRIVVPDGTWLGTGQYDVVAA